MGVQAMDWVPSQPDSARRKPNPGTSAVVVGLWALGSLIWLGLQLAQILDLSAAQKAFDGAAACTLRAGLPCRQTASGKITYYFESVSRPSHTKGCCVVGGSPQQFCALTVQVGAESYDEDMAPGTACNFYRGEVDPVVIYNGRLVAIDGKQTQANPDWAVASTGMWLGVAGFLSLLTVPSAIYLGARALSG